MKLEEIEEMWSKDVVIDKTDLGNEALRQPQMFAKYLTIYTKERRILKALEAKKDVLEMQKREFYVDGHNEETKAKGWKLPPKGAITLKSDVPGYLAADEDIIAMNLKIEDARIKVDAVNKILDYLRYNMLQAVRAAIDFNKFISGG